MRKTFMIERRERPDVWANVQPINATNERAAKQCFASWLKGQPRDNNASYRLTMAVYSVLEHAA